MKYKDKLGQVTLAGSNLTSRKTYESINLHTKSLRLLIILSPVQRVWGCGDRGAFSHVKKRNNGLAISSCCCYTCYSGLCGGIFQCYMSTQGQGYFWANTLNISSSVEIILGKCTKFQFIDQNLVKSTNFQCIFPNIYEKLTNSSFYSH